MRKLFYIAFCLFIGFLMAKCHSGDKNITPTELVKKDTIKKDSLPVVKAIVAVSNPHKLSAKKRIKFGAGSPLINFALDTIPYSSNDILSPARGAFWWNGYYSVNIPYLTGSPVQTPPIDYYYRFPWNAFEDAASGVYNWAAFDAQVQNAINHGGKFSYGIMTACPTCNATTIGGFGIVYPTWLHNSMQAQTFPDWHTPLSNTWVPNWNSSFYLNAWKALNVALNAHINATSYNGVAFKNVINFIDLRGFGSFGEWDLSFISNSPSDEPAGTQATQASLDSIVNYQLEAYPNFRLVMLASALDGNQLNNTQVPPEVGYRLLTSSNAAGAIGYRRDNWGGNDFYIDHQFGVWNATVYNGLTFGVAVQNIYKTALVTGEPLETGGQPVTCDYDSMNVQMLRYHASSFGNGNYDEASQVCMQNNIIKASKTSGYRYQVKSGSVTSILTPGNTFALTLNWTNIGIAATYENWNVQFELRNGATVLQTWTSAFSPRLMWQAAQTVTDNFTLNNGIATGTYGLYLIIRDPNGYRKPLPLGNSVVQSDGSYLLTNVQVGVTLPVANAGANQSINLPTKIFLNGSSSTGAITTYQWTQVGTSPGIATILTPTKDTTTVTVNPSALGVYTFKLTVKDALGDSSTATTTVTVGAHTPPTVSAGNNQTIPQTGQAVLNGTATAFQGTFITNWLWTEIAGLAGHIASPTSQNTIANNMSPATYVYQLKVTDSYGSSDSATVQIVVTAVNLPTANAGAPQTILFPNSIANLNGSASVNATSYSWSQIGNTPSLANIINGTTATPTVTALGLGTYTFQLKVGNGWGNFDSARTTVTVTNNCNCTISYRSFKRIYYGLHDYKPPFVLADTICPKPTLIVYQNPNGVLTLPVDSIVLQAVGTSQNGSAISYSFTKVDSSPYTMSIIGNKATFKNLSAGISNINVKATDGCGANTSQNIVFVLQNPTKYITNVSSNTANTVVITWNDGSMQTLSNVKYFTPIQTNKTVVVTLTNGVSTTYK